MTPAAVRPRPVSLDLAPHPFRPAKDVFGSYLLRCAVVGRIAVPAAGRLAHHSVSGRFVTCLDRRSWECSFSSKHEAHVALLKNTRQTLGALATSKVLFGVKDEKLTNCLSFRKHLSWPSASRPSRIIKERAEFRHCRTVGPLRRNCETAAPTGLAARCSSCVSVAARS